MNDKVLAVVGNQRQFSGDRRPREIVIAVQTGVVARRKVLPEGVLGPAKMPELQMSRLPELEMPHIDR